MVGCHSVHFEGESLKEYSTIEGYQLMEKLKQTVTIDVSLMNPDVRDVKT